MSEFGTTDSCSLKSALDNVFNIGGNTTLDDHNTKLVLTPSAGANVKLGVYKGALTMLKAEHPSPVIINCVNHRVKLAIKDAVEGIAQFAECDTLIYIICSKSRVN